MLGYQKQCDTLEDVNRKEYLHGHGSVPGNNIDGSSYRGELAGILAVIIRTNLLCKKHDVHGGQCTIWVDNKGAGIAAFGHKRPTSNWKCYDLVSMIRHHIQLSSITWLWNHIKSHQDEGNNFRELSAEAQGNIIVDQLAGEAHGFPFIWPTQLLLGEPWRCAFAGQYFVGNLKRQLSELIYKPRVQTHWIRVFKIPQDLVSCCSWDLFLWQLGSQESRQKNMVDKVRITCTRYWS